MLAGIASRNKNYLQERLLSSSEPQFPNSINPVGSFLKRTNLYLTRSSVSDSLDKTGLRSNIPGIIACPSISSSGTSVKHNKWKDNDFGDVSRSLKQKSIATDHSVELNFSDKTYVSLSSRRAGRSISVPPNEIQLSHNGKPQMARLSTPRRDTSFSTPASRCASIHPKATRHSYDSAIHSKIDQWNKRGGPVSTRGSSEPGGQNGWHKVSFVPGTESKVSDRTDFSHRSQSHPAKGTYSATQRISLNSKNFNWWAKRHKDSKPPWFPAGRGGTAVSHHRQFHVASNRMRITNLLRKVAAKGSSMSTSKLTHYSPKNSYMTIGLEKFPTGVYPREQRQQSKSPVLCCSHQQQRQYLSTPPKQQEKRKNLFQQLSNPYLTQTYKSSALNQKWGYCSQNYSGKQLPVANISHVKCNPNSVHIPDSRWLTNENIDTFRRPRYPINQSTMYHLNPSFTGIVGKPHLDKSIVSRNRQANLSDAPQSLVGTHTANSDTPFQPSTTSQGSRIKSPEEMCTRNPSFSSDLVKSRSDENSAGSNNRTKEMEMNCWDVNATPRSPELHSAQCHTVSARSLTSLDMDLLASSCQINDLEADGASEHSENTLHVAPQVTGLFAGQDSFGCPNASIESTSHACSVGPVTYASLWDQTYDCPSLHDGISSMCVIELPLSQQQEKSRNTPNQFIDRVEQELNDPQANRETFRLRAASQETLVHVTDVSEITENQYSSLASKVNSLTCGDEISENQSWKGSNELDVCETSKVSTCSSANEKESAPPIESPLRDAHVKNDGETPFCEGDCDLRHKRFHEDLGIIYDTSVVTMSMPVHQLSGVVMWKNPGKNLNDCSKPSRAAKNTLVKPFNNADEQYILTRSRGRRRFLRKLKRTVRGISTTRRKTVVSE